VQEQNGQLVAALKKAAQEAKDLGDAKSDLDIELSKHQLQLSTAQSEVRATGPCFLPMPRVSVVCVCVCV
jgi:predicted  nucleic acid-binding Zn-ribbon protein